MLQIMDFYSILDQLEDGVYMVDNNRRFLYWNAAAERITGYSQAEIIGRDCHENILRHIDEKGTPFCTLGCPLFDTLGDGKPRQASVYLRHKAGHRVPITAKFLPLYQDDGSLGGAIEIFTCCAPVVRRSKLMETLEHEVLHDKLTGLPNRNYTDSYLNYKLEEYRRFRRQFCIIFADIDDFHHFNNSYGHALGDKLLRAIATSLRTCLRRGDFFGRWGGEEFIGIFDVRNGNTDELSGLGERLRALVAGTQIELGAGGERIHASISGGLTVCQPEDTVESIVHRADLLMLESKRQGKNRVLLG